MSNQKVRDSIIAEVMAILANRDNGIREGFNAMHQNVQQAFGATEIKLMTIVELLKSLGITNEMFEATFTAIKTNIELQQKGGAQNVPINEDAVIESGEPVNIENDPSINEGGSDRFRRDN